MDCSGRTVTATRWRLIGLLILTVAGACCNVQPTYVEEMYNQLYIAAALGMTSTEFETSVKILKGVKEASFPIVERKALTRNAGKIRLYFLKDRSAFEYALTEFIHTPSEKSAMCLSFLLKSLGAMPSAVVETIRIHKDGIKGCLLNIAARFSESRKVSLPISDEVEEAVESLATVALKIDVDEFLPYVLSLFCALPQFEARSILIDIVDIILRLAHKQEKFASATKLTVFAAAYKYRDCSDGQVKRGIAYQIIRLFAGRFAKEIYELTEGEIETILAEVTGTPFSFENDLVADVVSLLQPYSNASKIAPLLLLLYEKCSEYGKQWCLYALIVASKRIAKERNLSSSLDEGDAKEPSRVFSWYLNVLNSQPIIFDFSFARFVDSRMDRIFLKKMLQEAGEVDR